MERHGVPAIDPFPANLRWPKEDTLVGVIASDEPDPFEAKERDRILEWYRQHKPYWYPFLQFWTGCRPSETAALREADVDLKEGTVRINKSRDEGEDNEPKTRGSKRMIKLYPNVIDVLVSGRAARMHPKPDDFFFTGPESAPLVRPRLADGPRLLRHSTPPGYPTTRFLLHARHVHLVATHPRCEPLGRREVPWHEPPDDRAALREVHPGSRPRPSDHRGSRAPKPEP
jgi:integrase